jgi:hypothetical protein
MTTTLQRGFLLSGSMTMNNDKRKKKNKQSSSSSSTESTATTNPKEDHIMVSTRKENSVWTKGFLTTKKKKKTSTIKTKKTPTNDDPETETEKKIRERRQASTITTLQSVENYNNSNINNQNNKTKIQSSSPITFSRDLLSIDKDDDNDIQNTTINNGTNKTRIIDTTNNISNTIATKSLISIVVNGDDDENDDVTEVSSMRTRREQQQQRISENKINNTKTKTTTKNLINPSSFVSPLISVVGDKNDDGDEGIPLLKEVSTNRKSKEGRSEGGGIVNLILSRKVSSTPETVHEEELNCASTSTTSNKDGEKEEIKIACNKVNNDDKEEGNSDMVNILKFQQELENILTRPKPKQQKQLLSPSPRHTGGNITTNKPKSDNDDSNNNNNNNDGDSHNIMNARSWTTERRLWMWTHMLHRRQHRGGNRSLSTNNTGNGDDEFDLTRELFSELFDAEYYHHRRGFIPISNDDDESTNNNSSNSNPLESILRSVETEEDRRLAYQAVLVIQEHYTYRRRYLISLQNSDRNNDILKMMKKKNNYNNIEIINKELLFSEEGSKQQQGMIQQLIPLIIDLVMNTSDGRRTRMAQIAWEAAILLMTFRIRYYCCCCFYNKKYNNLTSQPLSSSSSSNSDHGSGGRSIAIEEENSETLSSSSSSHDNNAPSILLLESLLPMSFWKQMQTLIQRQVMWKRSKKKKTNDTKINQLRDLERKVKDITINKAVTDSDNDLLNDDRRLTTMQSVVLMNIIIALEEHIEV